MKHAEILIRCARKSVLWMMYGEKFYGRHTAQHGCSDVKLKSERVPSRTEKKSKEGIWYEVSAIQASSVTLLISGDESQKKKSIVIVIF